MMNIQTKVEEMAKKIDAVNAEYIMGDHRIQSDIETAGRFQDKGDDKMVSFMLEGIESRIKEFGQINLTPANIQIGDGVTIHMYSDAHAGTVIKKTKTSVTIQRDKATMDPNFKPEFVVGGFAGHCTNQDKQTYTYEADPNGETMTFRWSKKYNRFQDGKTGRSLTKGRREFYDYNF
jgi:hypothetical protein